jgi:hypothetical protein
MKSFNQVYAVSAEIIKRFWPEEPECPWPGWEAQLNEYILRSSAPNNPESSTLKTAPRAVDYHRAKFLIHSMSYSYAIPKTSTQMLHYPKSSSTDSTPYDLLISTQTSSGNDKTLNPEQFGTIQPKPPLLETSNPTHTRSIPDTKVWRIQGCERAKWLRGQTSHGMAGATD